MKKRKPEILGNDCNSQFFVRSGHSFEFDTSGNDYSMSLFLLPLLSGQRRQELVIGAGSTTSRLRACLGERQQASTSLQEMEKAEPQVSRWPISLYPRPKISVLCIPYALSRYPCFQLRTLIMCPGQTLACRIVGWGASLPTSQSLNQSSIIQDRLSENNKNKPNKNKTKQATKKKNPQNKTKPKPNIYYLNQLLL